MEWDSVSQTTGPRLLTNCTEDVDVRYCIALCVVFGFVLLELWLRLRLCLRLVESVYLSRIPSDARAYVGLPRAVRCGPVHISAVAQDRERFGTGEHWAL